MDGPLMVINYTGLVCKCFVFVFCKATVFCDLYFFLIKLDKNYYYINFEYVIGVLRIYIVMQSPML